MAVVDLVIVALCIGFAVICWMNSRDPDAISSTSRPQALGTELPGIDDMPIMERMRRESEDQATAPPVVEEPIAEIDEIPELDDAEADKSEESKVECPNCNSHIMIEKKGEMQKIICDSCGFTGELEI
jgi:ssDNA-binding Zn-finger/Zn-ribbon topoisomerase 1